MNRQYKFLLRSASFRREGGVSTIESVNEIGKRLLHKNIPGIIDIFVDLVFVYDPMYTVIELSSPPVLETVVDESLYNRIILQNGSKIWESANGTKNIGITIQGKEYTDIVLEIIEE